MSASEGDAWVEFPDAAGAACFVAAVAWEADGVRTALPIAALAGRDLLEFEGELVLRSGERRPVQALARGDGWVWLVLPAELPRAEDCVGGRAELREVSTRSRVARRGRRRSN